VRCVSIQRQMAGMMESAQRETLVGREEELRELRAAIQKSESRLVWGPMDVMAPPRSPTKQ
jgi:hypothetical protein